MTQPTPSDATGSMPAATPPASGDVVRAQLSVNHLPPAERLPFWIDHIQATIARADCVVPGDGAFNGRIDHLSTAGVVSNHVSCDAQTVRYPVARVADMPYTSQVVYRQRSGHTRMKTRAGEVELAAGDIAVYPGYQVMDFEMPRAMDAVMLLVPSPTGLRVHTDVPERGVLRLAAGEPATRIAQAALARFHQSAGRLGALGAQVQRDEALQAVSAALDQSAGRSPSHEAALGRLASYHRRRVLDFVRAHLGDADLGIARIAAGVGLSVSQLHRLHQGAGQRLGHILWAERLAAAAAALRDPAWRNRTVAEVAFAHGFKDAAHFSRLFRAQHGMTPRDWRHDRS